VFEKITENFEKCILHRGFGFIFIEAAFFDGPAEYGKTLGLFSLSARFAHSNSKLTFVIFRSRQS